MHGSTIFVRSLVRVGCSLPGGFSVSSRYLEQQATFRWCGTFFRATCLNFLRFASVISTSAIVPIAKVQCQLVSVLTHLGRSCPWSVVLVSNVAVSWKLRSCLVAGGKVELSWKSDEVPIRYVDIEVSVTPYWLSSSLQDLKQRAGPIRYTDVVASGTRYWLSCSL